MKPASGCFGLASGVCFASLQKHVHLSTVFLDLHVPRQLCVYVSAQATIRRNLRLYLVIRHAPSLSV